MKKTSELRQEKLEYIKKNMEIYWNTTGIPCFFVDEAGKQLIHVGPKNLFCTVYNILGNDEKSCVFAHKKSSEQSENLGESYIFFCPAGLVHYTAAIRVGKVFEGSIIAGPVQMSETDFYTVQATLNSFQLEDDYMEELISSYKEVSIISPKVARYQLMLLNILVEDIERNSNVKRAKQKAFFDEQRLLSEQIQEMKTNPINEVKADSGKYMFELGNKLSEYIERGDEALAKGVLNDWFGYIFYTYRGNNRRIVTLFLDILSVMKRTAIANEVRYNYLAEITDEIYEKAYQSEEIEKICLWISDALEKIINLVFPLNAQNKEHISVIKRAITYMNQNIYEELTLDSVANEVGLSSSYFSRTFSCEMDMTFIEYLQKIRIEESKKYLVDPDYSLSDIGILLRFNDQSYYSKVFKKVEGITPGKFRRMYI